MTNSLQSYSVPETEINIWRRKSFHCRDQCHFPLQLGICLKVPIRAWVWNRVTCPPVSCLRACGQPFKGHRPSAESSMPPLLSCSRGICQCQVALLLLLQTSQELETSAQSPSTLPSLLLQWCYCARRRNPILAHIKILYLWCQRFLNRQDSTKFHLSHRGWPPNKVFSGWKAFNFSVWWRMSCSPAAATMLGQFCAPWVLEGSWV